MVVLRCLPFLAILYMSKANVTVPRITLNDGFEIPALALGTYLGFDQNGIITSKNDELKHVIEKAIDAGYRHFDTAAVYETEEELGRGIRSKIEDGTVTRRDIFVTTKLWNTDHERNEADMALQASLRKLQLSYIDVYLMHWPMGLNKNYTHSEVDYTETWKAMEQMKRDGLVRSIGVSNFNIEQLSRLMDLCDVKPAVLQIEVHPNIIQEELINFCKEHDVKIMSYSPFGPLVNRYGLGLPPPGIKHPTLTRIADKYGKTTPQVVLRWLVDRGTIPIPKTTNPKRLIENINIFDFELDRDEIGQINAFDVQRRYTLPSFWQSHKYYPFEKVDKPIPDPFLQ